MRSREAVYCANAGGMWCSFPEKMHNIVQYNGSEWRSNAEIVLLDAISNGLILRVR